MSMVIARPSIGADVCDIDNAQLGATAKSSAPAFATICVVFCSMLAAGCTLNPPQPEFSSAQHEVKAAPVHEVKAAPVHEVKAAPVRVAARPRQYSVQSYSKPVIRRPDAALLAPQPAPDCELTRSGVSAVDPNEWARLKLEYERQCYQDAEKAARERLSQLQASSTCEVEPVRQPKMVYQQSTQR